MDYRHEDPPYPYAQAAQTKAGWLAQVCVGDKVVWESEPVQAVDNNGRAEALRVAGQRIAEVWEALFA